MQELAGGGSLLGSLHQTPRHEVDKLGAPSVGRKLDDEILYDLQTTLPITIFEGRRGLGGYHEDGPHGMDVAIRRLPLRHLQRGDAQAPDVGHAVVADLLDHLRTNRRSVLCGPIRGEYFIMRGAKRLN